MNVVDLCNGLSFSYLDMKYSIRGVELPILLHNNFLLLKCGSYFLIMTSLNSRVFWQYDIIPGPIIVISYLKDICVSPTAIIHLFVYCGSSVDRMYFGYILELSPISKYILQYSV